MAESISRGVAAILGYGVLSPAVYILKDFIGVTVKNAATGIINIGLDIANRHTKSENNKNCGVGCVSIGQATFHWNKFKYYIKYYRELHDKIIKFNSWSWDTDTYAEFDRATALTFRRKDWAFNKIKKHREIFLNHLKEANDYYKSYTKQSPNTDKLISFFFYFLSNSFSMVDYLEQLEKLVLAGKTIPYSNPASKVYALEDDILDACLDMFKDVALLKALLKTINDPDQLDDRDQLDPVKKHFASLLRKIETRLPEMKKTISTLENEHAQRSLARVTFDEIKDAVRDVESDIQQLDESTLIEEEKELTSEDFVKKERLTNTYRRSYTEAQKVANRSKVAPEGTGEAIYAAAEKGDSAELLKLVEPRFAHPVLNDYSGGGGDWTPLIIASCDGYIECVKILVAQPGIEINKGARSDQSTALYWASCNGHVEIVELLCSQPGIDCNKTDKYGDTPHSIACVDYSGTDKEEQKRKIRAILEIKGAVSKPKIKKKIKEKKKKR